MKVQRDLEDSGFLIPGEGTRATTGPGLRVTATFPSPGMLSVLRFDGRKRVMVRATSISREADIDIEIHLKRCRRPHCQSSAVSLCR